MVTPQKSPSPLRAPQSAVGPVLSPRKAGSRTKPVPSLPKTKAASRTEPLLCEPNAKATGRTGAWKSSDTPAAVREFFAKPRRLAECNLVRQLFSDDATDHRRAAEMARVIGMREPGALSPYANLLADVAATWPIAEWQARQYVLVAAALAAGTHAQRMRLVPLIRDRLQETRIAVRAMALEAFAVLAVCEPELRDEAMEMLECARHSTIPALRARARLMLPQLLKAEASSSR